MERSSDPEMTFKRTLSLQNTITESMDYDSRGIYSQVCFLVLHKAYHSCSEFIVNNPREVKGAVHTTG